MIKKLNILLIVSCVSVAMHGSQHKQITGSLWPDGRECFADLAESKIEPEEKNNKRLHLSPIAGEILVSGNKTRPNAALPADQLKISAPKRLRSIIDDVMPVGLKSVPNDVWKKYINPAHNAGQSVFPIEFSDLKDIKKYEEIFWQSKDGLLQGVRADDQSKIIEKETKKVLFDVPSNSWNISFSPDDTMIAFHEPNRLKVVRFATKQELVNIFRAGDEWKQYFSSDNKWFITSFNIFDLCNPENVSWYIAGGAEKISPDNSMISIWRPTHNGAEFQPQHITVYDMQTRQPLFTKPNISDCGFTPDGRYVYGFEFDNGKSITKFFDVKNGEPVLEIEGKSHNFINETMLPVSFKGELRMYFIVDGKSQLTKEIQLPDGQMATVPDGKYVKHTKYIWDTRYCHIDGQKIIMVNDAGATIALHDLDSGKEIHSIPYLLGGSSLSPDKRFLISDYKGTGQVILFDIANRTTHQFKGYNPKFSADNKWLAIKSYSKLEIIDLKTKTVCLKLDLSDPRCFMHFAPYGPLSIVVDPARADMFVCDLSILEDPAIQKIINGELTLEQSLLLGYLSQIKKENNKKLLFKNRPISLLKDIAQPRVLVLRELQAILASFPPKIQETIVKKFNIVDATEKDILAQKAIREKNKQWMMRNVGHAAVAGAAIAVEWLTK